MPHLNEKAPGHGTQDMAHSNNFRGQPKKKVKIVYISDCGSSSSSDDGDGGSFSENDSIEESIGTPESERMNYDEGGGDTSSWSEEEGPPQKRSKKSKEQMKTRNGTGKDHNGNGDEKVEEEEFYVEKILEMRSCPKTKKNYFLVKWLNYESDDNTWEPEENLENSKDLLEEFLGRSKSNGNRNVHSSVKKKQKQAMNDDNSGTVSSGSAKRKHSADSVQTTENSESRVVLKSKDRILGKSEEDVNERIKLAVSQVKKGGVQVQITSPIKTSKLQNGAELPDMGWLEGLGGLSVASVIATQPGNIFYFRVISNDGKIEWIDIDTTAPLPNCEEVYRCVVTEDLTGKKPKLIYGATTSLDGDHFCLVQFEGQNYVDVIPPGNLFARFPSFRKFFELHCPKLFSQKNRSISIS